MDPLRERIATEITSLGSREILASLIYSSALILWGILATIFLLLFPPLPTIASYIVLGGMAVFIFGLDARLINTRIEDCTKKGFWTTHVRQSILFYIIVGTGISGFLGLGRLGAALGEGPLKEEERLLFIGLGAVCAMAIAINGIVLAMVRRSRMLTSAPFAPSSLPTREIS